MEELFDKLAKDVSGKVTRRQAFGRFGWGFAMAVFASLGLTQNNDCGKNCAACCNNLDFPPRSPEHGQCIKDCHQGLAPCGDLPGVCPQTP